MRVVRKWYLCGFGKYKMELEEIKEPREPGYYWCQDNGKWTIQEWNGDKWWLDGTPSAVKDSYWEAIHEERIEEPKYKI